MEYEYDYLPHYFGGDIEPVGFEEFDVEGESLDAEDIEYKGGEPEKPFTLIPEQPYTLVPLKESIKDMVERLL